MNITEVIILEAPKNADRVLAFCSVCLGGEFVVRDLKVIDGRGGLFVAMPSRKLADHCPACGAKNHLRARFCNHCGAKLGDDRARRGEDGATKLHADIAHPITPAARAALEGAVLAEYRRWAENRKRLVE